MNSSSVSLPPKPEPMIRTILVEKQTRTPSPSKKVGFHLEEDQKNSKRDSPNPSDRDRDVNPHSQLPISLANSPLKRAPLMKGRIYKQPTSLSANRSFNLLKQWQKRYLILVSESDSSFVLKYGVSEAALCSSNGVKGSIELLAGMKCLKGKKSKSFELYMSESCYLRSIAETDEERDRWIRAIRAALEDLEANIRRQGPVV
jgi:hypothetical protein